SSSFCAEIALRRKVPTSTDVYPVANTTHGAHSLLSKTPRVPRVFFIPLSLHTSVSAVCLVCSSHVRCLSRASSPPLPSSPNALAARSPLSLPVDLERGLRAISI